MKKFSIFLFLCFVFMPLSLGHAAVKGQVIEYKEGDTVLEGYWSYDDALSGPRPVVVLVHDWMGMGDYVKHKADQVAALGVVAFAADIYGKGVRPADQKEAGAQASIYKKDRLLMRRRIDAALAAARDLDLADKRRMVVAGYCFGGTVALEAARSGADIAGVVSFHGGLSSPLAAASGNVKAKVLVLHGADDPFVPVEEVAAFENEMRASGTDWQLIAYGGAVHSFTRPDAGADNSKGAAYNEAADRRSWQAFKSFLNELFL